MSYDPRGGDRLGLSFFFRDPNEFGEFCRCTQAPPELVRELAGLRERYSFVERDWVKLIFRNGRPAGWAAYLAVEPELTAPITTLRQLARRYQLAAAVVAALEPGFAPALDLPEASWFAVLRYQDPFAFRIACCLRAEQAGPVLDSLAEHGLIPPQAYPLPQAGRVYLTVTLGSPELLALDYEVLPGLRLGPALPPGARYLKFRPKDREWTVYRPLYPHEIARLAPEG